MIDEQPREPDSRDSMRRCRCNAIVRNPLLSPRHVVFDQHTGLRHRCVYTEANVRDPFECNCGAVVYGRDGIKYARPIGEDRHECADAPHVALAIVPPREQPRRDPKPAAVAPRTHVVEL